MQELTLLLSHDQKIPDVKCGIIDTLKSFHFQCTKSQFLQLMQQTFVDTVSICSFDLKYLNIRFIQ